MAEDALWQTQEVELTTYGRRTGRDHTVRVWFGYEDGVLWLRTGEIEPDWLRNLKADPRCSVRIGDRSWPARYEPPEDRDAALKRVVRLWREKYGVEWVQDWYVETGREPVPVRLL